MCTACGGTICGQTQRAGLGLPFVLVKLALAAVVVFTTALIWMLRTAPRVTLIGLASLGIAYGLHHTRYYAFWAESTGVDIAGWAILAALTALISYLAEALYRNPEKTAQIASEAVEETPDPIEQAEALRVARWSARLQRQIDALGINATLGAVDVGPVVMRFEITPGFGTKLNTLLSRGDEFATALRVDAARVSLAPGEGLAVVEVPNPNREAVPLSAFSAVLTSSPALSLPIGLTPDETPLTANLQEMPHLLVCGTTGAGKSVTLNAWLATLLERHGPEQLRLVLIDPKQLELAPYAGIPHLLCPPVTEAQTAVRILARLIETMEDRYRAMAAVKVKDIERYNARMRALRRPNECLPYLVVIVDELAELMLQVGAEIEAAVQSLTQKARACGIHLIFATQRPSAEVISGDIKANFKVRLCLQVADKTASRVAIDRDSAEQLLDKGDGLLYWAGRRLQRVHTPLIEETALEALIERWQRWAVREGWRDEEWSAVEAVEAVAVPTAGAKAVESESVAVESMEKTDNAAAALDVKFQEAVAVVYRTGKVSEPLLRRELKISGERARVLMEQMAAAGLISESQGQGKARVVYRERFASLLGEVVE